MRRTTSVNAETILKQFTEYLASKPNGSLGEFVESRSIVDAGILSKLVIQDIGHQYNRGTQIPVRCYFDAYPMLSGHDLIVQGVLDQDFRQQFQLQLCHDIADYRTGDAQLDAFLPNGSELTGSDQPDPSAKVESRDLTGATIRDYLVTDVLNFGRKATVYKAEDQHLKRTVVLKVSDRMSKLAVREARFLARLEHPNILPIHDGFECDGRLFIVTRYVAGSTLADLIDHWHDGEFLEDAVLRELFGDLTGYERTSAAVEVVCGIVRAIQHAHNHGVVHCDIKPGNVLIESTGNPQLMDFDIALSADSNDASLGATVGYMSPEQNEFHVGQNVDLKRRIDHRTDIYSIGVVLHELVSGRLPDESVCKPAATTIWNDISGTRRSLDSIINKCLARNVDGRYQSAGQLLNDLQSWLQGRTPKFAVDRYLPGRLLRSCRRHPMVLTLAVGVAVLIAIGLATTYTGIRNIENSLTHLEMRLEEAGSADIADIARKLIQTRAAIDRNPSFGFLFPGKRENAAQRMEIVLWKLARRENELMTGYTRVSEPTVMTASDRSVLSLQDTLSKWQLAGEIISPDFLRKTSEFREEAEWVWVELLKHESPIDPGTVEVVLPILFPCITKDLRIALLEPSESFGQLSRQLALQSTRPESGGIPDARASGTTASLGELEWYLLGLKFELQRDLNSAIICFEHSVNRGFDLDQIPELSAIRRLANCLLEERNHESAARYLEMAVELDPPSHGYRHQLGLVKEVLGLRKQAIYYLQSAVKLSPESTDYHADLGAVCIRDEQFGRGIRSLDEAIRQGDSRPDTRINRAVAMYLSGDSTGAAGELEDLANRYPENETVIKLLNDLRRQGKRE